jgi:hypothetical protein
VVVVEMLVGDNNKNIFLIVVLFFLFSIGYFYFKKSFLDNHWSFPVPEQGSKRNISKINLEPKKCGSCHTNQYHMWKNSIHGHSISSGMVWQLEDMNQKDFENCLACHSPLKEGQTYIAENLNKDWFEGNSDFSYLKNEEDSIQLNCIGCHIRKFTFYGPTPRNQKSLHSSHDSFIIKNEFDESQFCKTCHESRSEGITLKGKKLMETYTEWENSPFYKKNIHCQNCHMPNREHSWKGIHDREMVLSGIKSELNVKKLESNFLISAYIQSINIGHKFPTYSIPKLYLKLIFKKDNQEKILDEKILGRLLENDLSAELFDNRLSPGEMLELNSIISNTDGQIIFRVEVDPEEMYVRIFEDKVSKIDPNSINKINLILNSIEEKKKLRYKLFEINKNL